MRTLGMRKVAGVGLCLAVLVTSGHTYGESRKKVSFRGLTRPGRIGEYTSLYDFRRYSYGLGGLGKRAPAGSRNILKSTIGRPAELGLRSTGQPARLSSAMPRLPGGRVGKFRYTPRQTIIRPPRERHRPSSTAILDKAPTIGAADAYASMIGEASVQTLARRDQAITSLVPDDQSPYGQHIAKGEEAFRDGDFVEAYNQFTLANQLERNDPASFLSLAHASFAKAPSASYNEPAYYLGEALRYMPTLPLAPLQPKAFYGQTPAGIARYTRGITRLEDHLKTTPSDANGHLVLAYFQWFSGQTDAARKSLSRALASARQAGNEDIMEALNIFWDGMVASGKVTGRLSPATQPVDSPAPPAATKPSAAARTVGG